MGRDKAFLPFGDGDLVHFVYGRCERVFAHTLLCFKTPKPDVNLPMIVESLCAGSLSGAGDLSEAGERFKSEGKNAAFSPLQGIACALRELRSAYVAFVSVDTPFVDPKILDVLHKRVRECGANGGYIVQVNEYGVLVREHYLLSVWHRDTLDSITRAIEAREFRVRDLVRGLGFITHAVCDTNLDHNLNTKEDYRHALEILSQAH